MTTVYCYDYVWDELPPRDRAYVLAKFMKEWAGNIKEGCRMASDDAIELMQQYPEIWGDYVRAYIEETGQDIHTGVPAELQGDQVEREDEQDIEPEIGWHTGEVGCDTYEKGL